MALTIKSATMGKKYLMVLLGGCLIFSSRFKDKGNYSYSAVNDIIIGSEGFVVPYVVRTDVDELVIEPIISSTIDPDLSGTYTYEWVAVSTQKLPGTRYTLSTERVLDYAVKIPADEYNLFFKVTDVNTGLVFSNKVALTVNGSYTRGWMVVGEDNTGQLVLDMISISKDTLHLKDILKAGLIHLDPTFVWVDNSPESYENYVYVCTEHDTYRYDREGLDKAEELRIFDPDSKGYRNNIVMSDIQRVKEKRTVFLADGYAYANTTLNEGEFGNPVNYYITNTGYDYFSVGSKTACNRIGEDKSAAAIDQYVFYNVSDKKFCYLRQLASNMYDLLDKDSEEPFSWDTSKDFPPNGLEFVTTINSMFGSGQSATILKDPGSGKFYIYTYAITRQGGTVTKGARYEIPASVIGLRESNLFSMTTRQGYLIYAVNGTLYGYDFRKNSSPVILATFLDEEITAIYNDIVSEQQMEDYFYVATYKREAKNGRGGTVRKYSVEDTPEQIKITEELVWKEFPRVINLCYKQF